MPFAAALLLAIAVDGVELRCPTCEDTVQEGAAIALEATGRKRCQKAFRLLDRTFDPQAWLLDGELAVIRIGDVVSRQVGYDAAGASSCRAGRRIGMNPEIVTFLGPEYAAEVFIHEMGHLVTCDQLEMTREQSEANAERVVKRCFPDD